ncbi:hypothetical protein [Streptomyces sporangiiformans]|uniref:Uncharacterized protein n=1 Tax=Streptomyces sporangiiformans TaxID=2315329 RepID=A0A505D4J3_9ACTN|nr:hypothetical protein [Streptomyces sporangiiformans]TPQ17787.1 hypothetical protein FGD71_034555 [Streptomyces sporangiiformans]
MIPTAARAEGKPPTAEEEQRRKTDEQEYAEQDTLLYIHTAHPEVPVPYFTPGDLKASAQAVTSRLPTAPTKDVLFYGGLGVLAVAGALEWPIALAIGGATMVVRGSTKGETKERQESYEEKEKEREKA